MPASPFQLASEADQAHGTTVFTWMTTHEPSAVVIWRGRADELSRIFPRAHVQVAGPKPCSEAKKAHAELLLIARVTAARDRDLAEDCGFALFRDGGAIVSAPR